MMLDTCNKVKMASEVASGGSTLLLSTRSRQVVSSVVLLPRRGGDALWNLNFHDRRASLPMDPYLLELQSLWLASASGVDALPAATPRVVGAEPLTNVMKATPPSQMALDTPYIELLPDCGQAAVYADSGALLVVVFVEPRDVSSLSSVVVGGTIPTLVEAICQASRLVLFGSAESRVEGKEVSVTSTKIGELGQIVLSMIGPSCRSLGPAMPELE